MDHFISDDVSMVGAEGEDDSSFDDDDDMADLFFSLSNSSV